MGMEVSEEIGASIIAVLIFLLLAVLAGQTSFSASC
jgi:hypothetical protein